LGVSLSVPGGERLHVNAPKGKLPKDVRAQIAERKAEILALMRRRFSTIQIVVPPIKSRARGEPAPLSFAQERLWFLEQLEPKNTAYNICRASRLLGKLSSPLLEASLNEIVSRHETLRTAFRLIDGKPVQVVRPAEGLSIDFVDLSSLKQSECAANIQREIESRALRPFNLESGAMLRCALLRVAEQEHILVLATHHSAADAWSIGTLTRELWTLYDAFSNGRPCPLEPLPVQYSDCAVWQREWLQGDVLESQLGYWKERLKDLSVLNLPTDQPRKPRQSFHGARLTIELPYELTSAVTEMSHRFAVTPFMILLAAFQVLLYRYTGQEDVMVGSPIANRRRPEVEGLIGFFVNTLVLRADLSGNPSFTELLFHVRDVCVGANANQDLPFEKLVQKLQPERDQSRNPLFQVMFVLQNATRPFTGIPGLRIEPLEIATTRSPFDLSLVLRERNGKYLGNIEYSTELFDHDRIERMAGHFRTLLEAIVYDPDQSIATLPILTPAERHQILIEWNDTAADCPKDKCIYHLFEEQVERTPEAIAVEFEDQQITYRELNRRANQLAHYLLTLAVGPEKLVGICVERSIEMMVGLLGILKARSAYVPLDPAYPEARLEFLLRDSRCSVLLTQQKWLGDKLAFTDSHSQLKIIALDRDADAIRKEDRENPRGNHDSKNLAYVIYTSGSTGTPKGVAIEHRNTVALLNWAKEVFTAGELAGVLASTSICFDLSVFELFVPLSWGGRVVLVENALQLSKRPNAKRITLINTVPSVMTALLRTGQLPDSVRVVNLAGEPLRPQLVEELYKTATVEKVYDLYGPSETTTYSTFTLRTTDSAATIGRPISNTQIYILDSNSQPVPIGVPGEIHIGGSGVARGYLGRTELTKEKFIKNPSSDDLNSRLYRTGDLARYLPDGQIVFHGRADNQVKIHGYRLELGEVESVLNQHPAVKESLVVVREDTREFALELAESKLNPDSRNSIDNPSSEKRLVAYIIASQQLVPAISDLRNVLAEKLPAYMVPAEFVFLDHFPLNDNGKLDRSKLPSPDESNRYLNELVIAPRTEIEELIANVWQDVLKLDNINVHDNFFELGGHSLVAIQIVARLSEALNREVLLKTLFDAPTISWLAKALENILSGSAAERLPPIVPVPRDQPLPLSLNQEHLWHLDQMIPGTHFFNMPYVFRLSGAINIQILEDSITRLIARHEPLRTVFQHREGDPIQIIHHSYGFKLPYVDLREFAVGDLEQRVARLILEERQRPFDIARESLFRAKLLGLMDTEYLLLMTLHHIVADHWSMQVIRNDLLELYSASAQGRSVSLPELPYQFADYASWERRCWKSGLFANEIDRWRNLVSGFADYVQPNDNASSKNQLSFEIEQKAFEIDRQALTNIRSIAITENCTVFILILAALTIVLHCRNRQRFFRFCAIVSNRMRYPTQYLVGPFLNTVTIEVSVVPTMSVRTLLSEVRKAALLAQTSQWIPFEALRRTSETEQSTKIDTKVSILLDYQRAYEPPSQTGGLNFAPFNLHHVLSGVRPLLTGFEMIFQAKESSTMLSGSVNYKIGQPIFKELQTEIFGVLNNLSGSMELPLSHFASGG
jgi:amino acid adenylation domain-containing protein